MILKTRSSSIVTDLNLVCNVKGIVVTSVREDDSVQGIGQTVHRGVFSPLKWVPEVRFGIFDFCTASQNHKTGNDDEEEKSDFDGTDCVGQIIREFCMEY